MFFNCLDFYFWCFINRHFPGGPGGREPPQEGYFDFPAGVIPEVLGGGPPQSLGSSGGGHTQRLCPSADEGDLINYCIVRAFGAHKFDFITISRYNWIS